MLDSLKEYGLFLLKPTSFASKYSDKLNEFKNKEECQEIQSRLTELFKLLRNEFKFLDSRLIKEREMSEAEFEQFCISFLGKEVSEEEWKKRNWNSELVFLDLLISVVSVKTQEKQKEIKNRLEALRMDWNQLLLKRK